MAQRCECGCGAEFTPKRSGARFASTACRVRWNRAQKAGRSNVVPIASRAPASKRLAPRGPVSGVEEATRAELGDEVDTVLGQSALVLARRLDAGLDVSGSAVATLVKQLAALMAQRPVGAGVDVAEDPVARARLAVAQIRLQHMAGAS